MKRVVLLLLFLVSLFRLGFAQVENISKERSKDKVMIGGQVYYVHVVKTGDSLYSLSKLYDVSQKEIAKENPEVFLGLKIGQALKIPYNQKKSVEGSEIKDSNNFLYHRVKKGQTVYSLSKKYNVSQEDIFACNPGVRYGINVNQILKIPKSKDIVESIQQYPIGEPLKDTIVVEEKFIYHKVKRGETKSSLATYYEISENMLLEYNPFLSRGLKRGQILKIPRIEDVEGVTLLFKADKEIKDSLQYLRTIAYSDSVDFGECDIITEFQEEPFQVAVFLPFYLEKNDEEFYIDSSEYNEEGDKIYERVYYSPFYVYPRSLNFVEFYEGFLLAIDTLKSKGLSVNLHVYDTANDTVRINEVLNYPEMKTMDLIFGPRYNHEVRLVSEFARENQIKMVSPLLDNLNLINENPYLFQVNPSYDSQIDGFAKFVSTFEDKNIVMVHNGDSLQYNNIEMVKSKIFANLSMDTLINNILFKEIIFKDSTHVFEHALGEEIENIFVIPSNEEAFVTDVLTNLNTLKSFGHDLTVVGLSRWQWFKNIDQEYYFNLDLHLATPFFIDYNEQDVKDFILKYRKMYKTEPDNWAIHGYDVGLYFLSALMNYGVEFENCIYNHNIDLLQANYRFVKWYEFSGYENVGVDMIKYEQGYNVFRCCRIIDEEKISYYQESP